MRQVEEGASAEPGKASPSLNDRVAHTPTLISPRWATGKALLASEMAGVGSPDWARDLPYTDMVMGLALCLDLSFLDEKALSTSIP